MSSWETLIELPSGVWVQRDDLLTAVRKLNQRADSETSKHRHLAEEFCQGNGVDLGSAGDPVVPWAIQVELPQDDYSKYNRTRPIEQSIHWRGSALELPFKDQTLDFVHSAHLLEDFEEWDTPLREWHRVLKSDGYLIIAIPDHERFRSHVRRHREEHGIDVDNLSHRSESLCRKGALTEWFASNMASPKYEVLYDHFVSDNPLEYSLLWIGRRLF